MPKKKKGASKKGSKKDHKKAAQDAKLKKRIDDIKQAAKGRQYDDILSLLLTEGGHVDLDLLDEIVQSQDQQFISIVFHAIELESVELDIPDFPFTQDRLRDYVHVLCELGLTGSAIYCIQQCSDSVDVSSFAVVHAEDSPQALVMLYAKQYQGQFAWPPLESLPRLALPALLSLQACVQKNLISVDIDFRRRLAEKIVEPGALCRCVMQMRNPLPILELFRVELPQLGKTGLLDALPADDLLICIAGLGDRQFLTTEVIEYLLHKKVTPSFLVTQLIRFCDYKNLIGILGNDAFINHILLPHQALRLIASLLDLISPHAPAEESDEYRLLTKILKHGLVSYGENLTDCFRTKLSERRFTVDVPVQRSAEEQEKIRQQDEDFQKVRKDYGPIFEKARKDGEDALQRFQMSLYRVMLYPTAGGIDITYPLTLYASQQFSALDVCFLDVTIEKKCYFNILDFVTELVRYYPRLGGGVLTADHQFWILYFMMRYPDEQLFKEQEKMYKDFYQFVNKLGRAVLNERCQELRDFRFDEYPSPMSAIQYCLLRLHKKTVFDTRRYANVFCWLIERGVHFSNEQLVELFLGANVFGDAGARLYRLAINKLLFKRMIQSTVDLGFLRLIEGDLLVYFQKVLASTLAKDQCDEDTQKIKAAFDQVKSQQLTALAAHLRIWQSLTFEQLLYQTQAIFDIKGVPRVFMICVQRLCEQQGSQGQSSLLQEISSLRESYQKHCAFQAVLALPEYSADIKTLKASLKTQGVAPLNSEKLYLDPRIQMYLLMKEIDGMDVGHRQKRKDFDTLRAKNPAEFDEVARSGVFILAQEAMTKAQEEGREESSADDTKQAEEAVVETKGKKGKRRRANQAATPNPTEQLRDIEKSLRKARQANDEPLIAALLIAREDLKRASLNAQLEMAIQERNSALTDKILREIEGLNSQSSGSVADKPSGIGKINAAADAVKDNSDVAVAAAPVVSRVVSGAAVSEKQVLTQALEAECAALEKRLTTSNKVREIAGYLGEQEVQRILEDSHAEAELQQWIKAFVHEHDNYVGIDLADHVLLIITHILRRISFDHDIEKARDLDVLIRRFVADPPQRLQAEASAANVPEEPMAAPPEPTVRPATPGAPAGYGAVPAHVMPPAQAYGAPPRPPQYPYGPPQPWGGVPPQHYNGMPPRGVYYGPQPVHGMPPQLLQYGVPQHVVRPYVYGQPPHGYAMPLQPPQHYNGMPPANGPVLTVVPAQLGGQRGYFVPVAALSVAPAMQPQEVQYGIQPGFNVPPLGLIAPGDAQAAGSVPTSSTAAITSALATAPAPPPPPPPEERRVPEGVTVANGDAAEKRATVDWMLERLAATSAVTKSQASDAAASAPGAGDSAVDSGNTKKAEAQNSPKPQPPPPKKSWADESDDEEDDARFRSP